MPKNNALAGIGAMGTKKIRTQDRARGILSLALAAIALRATAAIAHAQTQPAATKVAPVGQAPPSAEWTPPASPATQASLLPTPTAAPGDNPMWLEPNVEGFGDTKYLALQPENARRANDYPADQTQGAPAALENAPEAGSQRRSLPSYYYESWYYNTYGVGARAIADYAPPGYEPRDYQDGPGLPEFSRITPPTLPPEGQSPEVVTRGMFPGSFLVPGVNTSFRIRGFVRLTALEDFQPIGSADSFVTNTIPVPQQVGQNFNMSARTSRLAVESWTPTNFCDWNVHTLVEGDFFNGPAQAAGGGGNPFRLRHAFFDFGYFRFGQQNSVFMDGTNWPSLVDFQGPNSWVNQRQPSARMTLPVVDGVYWATSIERPFSDITTNGLGTNVQDVPDFATHLRYETDVGHLQVAGLLREIGYQPTGEDDTHRTAAGISGSAVFHPWAILMGTDPVHEQNPSGLTRSRVLLMTAWGPGVGRYINDLAGQGFDAQVDPVTGDFDLVESVGWNASYEHWFNEHWLSNCTYARVNPDNNAGQPATTYNNAQYLAASLWWIPIPRMSVGIEYLWGRRENFDGQDADAQRLNGLLQYDF